MRGARVVATTSGGRSADTDSLGRFELAGLAPGIHRFLIVVPGVPRSTVTLAFAKGERQEQVLEVDQAEAAAAAAAPTPAADTLKRADGQPLATVEVTAAPPMDRRYMDFERRLKTGRGQYLTRKQIEDGQFYSLQDAMRLLRGVKVDCGGGAGCFITMSRAPMGCTPDYIVDERVDNFFGPKVPVRDIEALEVYTGPSDVPGEFAGANAGCGLVVIWTRNGPPRAGRKPPTRTP